MTSFRGRRSDSKVGKDELITIASHYGNMRFAMFTVFTAILGAMIAFPFSKEHSEAFQSGLLRHGLSITGGVFSVFFGISQQRISNLVIYYQEKAFSQKDLLPPNHKRWACLASMTMLLPFIASLVFWIMFWFECI